MTLATESPRAFGQVRTYWSRWLPWARKGLFALLDQGFISGSNFISTILLARWLAPEAYGAYGLAFSIFLLLSLLNQAMILEPMSVFGPSRYRICQPNYLGSLLWIEGSLALPISFALGIAAWTAHESAPATGLSTALAGVAVAAPCLLLLELTRGAFYLKLVPQAAALGALLYSVIFLSTLWFLYRQGLMSSCSAFLLMALAALTVSGLQLFRLKPTLNTRREEKLGNNQTLEASNLGAVQPPRTLSSLASLRDVTRLHWEYGRWALASSLMVWIPWNIQFIFVSSFSSMAGAGELRALFNLTQPVAQAFAAFSLLTQPYASVRYQEQGLAGLQRVTRIITLLFVSAVVVYWSVIYVLRAVVVSFLYADKYPGVGPLIPWIALASIFRTVAYGPAIALRAMQSPASVFVAYGASSIIALVLGIPAARILGLRGVIFNIIISSAAAPIVELLVLYRKLPNSFEHS